MLRNTHPEPASKGTEAMSMQHPKPATRRKQQPCSFRTTYRRVALPLIANFTLLFIGLDALLIPTLVNRIDFRIY